jgi:hypothetical protein
VKTEAEVWIDVVCRGDGRNETMCTLFARHVFPTRPLIDESLSFLQEKGSNLEFTLVSAVGLTRSSAVHVTVDEVSHYPVKDDKGLTFNMTIRCSPIYVAAEQDALVVCDFMTRQLGFEIDPYAINKLAGARSQ